MAGVKANTKKDCCAAEASDTPPAHTKQLHRVKRIRGQLDGVERMITSRRYCPDIIIQLQAIRSALSALESKILEDHLYHCVKEAFQSGDEKQKTEKIEEILNLVRRS